MGVQNCGQTRHKGENAELLGRRENLGNEQQNTTASTQQTVRNEKRKKRLGKEGEWGMFKTISLREQGRKSMWGEPAIGKGGKRGKREGGSDRGYFPFVLQALVKTLTAHLLLLKKTTLSSHKDEFKEIEDGN